MGLLSYDALQYLIKNGVLENSDLANVNAASIDLVLGNTFWVEKRAQLIDGYAPVIDMLDKNSNHLEKIVTTPEHGIIVPPGGVL